MNRRLLHVFLLALLAPISAIAVPTTAIRLPVAVSVANGTVHVKNTSERILEVQLEIEGTNFLSQFPCTTKVWLGPFRQHTMTVTARNRALPADYEILVAGLSAKTQQQIAQENRGKPLPVATPMSKADLASMRRETCQSK